jgi:hypothetical protein
VDILSHSCESYISLFLAFRTHCSRDGPLLAENSGGHGSTLEKVNKSGKDKEEIFSSK